MMARDWAHTGYSLSATLDAYKWEWEIRHRYHPIHMRANRRELIDTDTGEVIAIAAEGYAWFWAHHHPHICKEDWDGSSANKR